LKEVYSKFNDQGKELEQVNRALTAMTEKFEEATKAAEESERFDICIGESRPEVVLFIFKLC